MFKIFSGRGIFTWSARTKNQSVMKIRLETECLTNVIVSHKIIVMCDVWTIQRRHSCVRPDLCLQTPAGNHITSSNPHWSIVIYSVSYWWKQQTPDARDCRSIISVYLSCIDLGLGGHYQVVSTSLDQ